MPEATDPLGDREGGDRRAKTLLRKPGDLPARTSFGPADGVFRDGETGLHENGPCASSPPAVYSGRGDDRHTSRLHHLPRWPDAWRRRDHTRQAPAWRDPRGRRARGRQRGSRRMPVCMQPGLLGRAQRARPLVLCLWPPVGCERAGRGRGRRGLCGRARRPRAVAQPARNLPQAVACPHSIAVLPEAAE